MTRVGAGRSLDSPARSRFDLRIGLGSDDEAQYGQKFHPGCSVRLQRPHALRAQATAAPGGDVLAPATLEAIDARNQRLGTASC